MEHNIEMAERRRWSNVLFVYVVSICVSVIVQINGLTEEVPWTQAKVRKFAYELAENTGLKTPCSWKKNQMAGKDWLTSFERNKTLSIRRPQATSMFRSTSFYKTNLQHQPSTLTADEITRVLSQTDLERMWTNDLRPMLVTRYPSSSGSLSVQQQIRGMLRNLTAGWELEEDRFQSYTPYGPLTFTNIIATLNPSAVRRLVLACHYDSKYYAPQWHGQEFVAATDSAVPCAMIMELVRSLDQDLKILKGSQPDLTLQLLFFDGEEALFQWSSTDSLYGSRHLAQKMESTAHPPNATNTNQLDGIDLFVLLDLIGAPRPRFGNHFINTSRWLSRLQNIERRLHRMGQLVEHPNEVQYFWPNIPVSPVEDDHRPFLSKGVRVLHLIPTPFPSVWHTFDDNEQNLDRPTIQNLNKVMQVFVLEYLGK